MSVTVGDSGLCCYCCDSFWVQMCSVSLALVTHLSSGWCRQLSSPFSVLVGVISSPHPSQFWLVSSALHTLLSAGRCCQLSLTFSVLVGVTSLPIIFWLVFKNQDITFQPLKRLVITFATLLSTGQLTHFLRSNVYICFANFSTWISILTCSPQSYDVPAKKQEEEANKQKQ